MLKNKVVLLILGGVMISLSSCGIFHKGCGCPHFGSVKTQIKAVAYC